MQPDPQDPIKLVAARGASILAGWANNSSAAKRAARRRAEGLDDPLQAPQIDAEAEAKIAGYLEAYLREKLEEEIAGSCRPSCSRTRTRGLIEAVMQGRLNTDVADWEPLEPARDPAVVAVWEEGRLTYSRDGVTCPACLVWKAHVLCGTKQCPTCGKPFPEAT